MIGFDSPTDALTAAIRAAGSQTKFAELCGVTQSAVSKWLARGQPLPAGHVLLVETATGVSRHDLRPDIYPRESIAGDRFEGLRA